MNEKSLLYSLFMKYLGEEEEETTEEKTAFPAGEEDGDGKVFGPGRTEDGHGQQALDAGKDSLIETVEDWNDLELEKKKRLDRSLTEEELPEEEEQEEDEAEEDLPDGVKHEGFGQEEGAVKDSAAAEPAVEEVKDAALEVHVSADKMEVSLMVWEPEGGGADITEEQICEKLVQLHVVHGIDEEKIRDIAAHKRYRQEFIIAAGEPPKNGENGRVKDFFPRQVQLKYATRQNGGIDFKNMNLIHNVKEGDVVCEIIRPLEPEDGMDVCGQPVRGKTGAMPPVPQGRNIVYSEDGTKLTAACEGNLVFRNGRFDVDKIYEVVGNVDNSVGNINFSGSVFIQGDVFEGYSVKAKGNITVCGMVEGAVLTAGGDIQLQKGMRGMRSGVLEAGGNITAKFLEDCTIHAGHDIQAEYIINSEVACEHNLSLIGRRGAFIGGSCAVYNEMNVKAVGAMSHITTTVTLGVTPQLMAEAEQVAEEIREAAKHQEENRKNTAWLIDKQNRGSLTPKQAQRLNELNLEATVDKLKQKKLQTRAGQLAKQIREVGRTRLLAQEVFPGTILCIGDSRLVIMKKEESVSYYYLDGEIRRGMR